MSFIIISFSAIRVEMLRIIFTLEYIILVLIFSLVVFDWLLFYFFLKKAFLKISLHPQPKSEMINSRARGVHVLRPSRWFIAVGQLPRKTSKNTYSV